MRRAWIAMCVLCLLTAPLWGQRLRWDPYPDPEGIVALELQRSRVALDGDAPGELPSVWAAVSVEIAPTAVEYEDPVPPGGYFWRLRARTADGAVSAWSNWTFKIIELPPPGGLSVD